ncbi:transposase domain-containing protein, partial [Acinetobacter sp. USHLN143]
MFITSFGEQNITYKCCSNFLIHLSGKASIRRRKLPAEHVVWLVIGLALFRDQPIGYVVEQ